MEIEVKILDVDKAAVIEVLKSLGAKQVFDGELNIQLYDFTDKRLQKDGSILRLRNRGEVSELAFKQWVSREKVKVMKEYEIVFREHSDAEKILIALGLRELKGYKRSKKHRTSLKLGDACFDFDTYEGIPTLLEVEAPTLEEVEKWVKKLGFSMENAKPWSGRDVFKHYGI
jgi:predicted adenylyl cyclase CyaB